MIVDFVKFWQNVSCYSAQYLLYWLTEVLPHPVTTTLVPADTSEVCKAMFCAQVLLVMGGST